MAKAAKPRSFSGGEFFMDTNTSISRELVDGSQKALTQEWKRYRFRAHAGSPPMH
jgi:hypothetical protein